MTLIGAGSDMARVGADTARVGAEVTTRCSVGMRGSVHPAMPMSIAAASNPGVAKATSIWVGVTMSLYYSNDGDAALT